MKTIYLVKRNPNVSNANNWLFMSGAEFIQFLQTPEGQQRKHLFKVIDRAESYDSRIIMECEPELAKQIEKEHNRKQYLRRVKQKSGYSTLYFDDVRGEDDELSGEDVVADEMCNVEEDAIRNIELQMLRAAIPKLTAEEQKIIHTVFYSGHSMGEVQCAKQLGITRYSLREKVSSILLKLKKML
jgi:RNA polymerase sigma factor (sigma-70 family)